MAVLTPIPFGSLLRRIFHEHRLTRAIFDLPERKFYRPAEDLDLSVTFCGNHAGNPLGPAAGPHTQLTQNIVLAWLAGSRIIELKTVQVNDRLQLTRPCIDMATVGYNTEWSQELTLEDSLREYVKASMTVEILKTWLSDKIQFGSGRLQETRETSHHDDTIFDVSVGYDLAGVRSKPVADWLRSMRKSTSLIAALRPQIPPEFVAWRDAPFNPHVANSITLSTFHGTPVEEIEQICLFLLQEMGYHVVIKMNPPMLGKQRLEDLLHERLGYTDIQVNPKVYDVNITFSEAVDVVRRLQGVASRCGRTVGVKFGNTLEVLNTGTFLSGNVQYLSGQPLHVLHLALVQEWRNVFGAAFPISFSAGVDATNFADCVAAGLVPVTVCTDILRPGGYGRLPVYLANLERRMKAGNAKTVQQFIASSALPSAEGASLSLHAAVIRNSLTLFENSLVNTRYQAVSNRKAPRKIGSHLSLWDCINCDKCIPVCPNDANFSFEVAPVEVHYKNVNIVGNTWTEVEGGFFKIRKTHQIATYADACNECGNCDVFCPEDGGPYVEKPRFFGSLEAWRASQPLSGFALTRDAEGMTLYGRFKDFECLLRRSHHVHNLEFHRADCAVTLNPDTDTVVAVRSPDVNSGTTIDMGFYFAMKALLLGITNLDRVNFVNAEMCQTSVSDT